VFRPAETHRDSAVSIRIAETLCELSSREPQHAVRDFLCEDEQAVYRKLFGLMGEGGAAQSGVR
jgi:hypothetical protein